jgi:hypothetical protein
VRAPAKLRVPQRHRAAFASGNRKHARLEQARADPFQQGRVAISPHDLFVTLAGLLFRQKLRGVLLAVHQQGELVDGAVVRQREHETGFDLPTAGVLENLRYLHASGRVAKPRVDLERFDLVARRSWLGSRRPDWARQADLFVGPHVHEQPLGERGRRKGGGHGRDQPQKGSLAA